MNDFAGSLTILASLTAYATSQGVIEYEIPDRDGDEKGEVIALVTTITQMTAASTPLLAAAYHQGGGT